MTADDRNILRDVADALEAGNASPMERASLANAVRLIVACDEAAQTKAMTLREAVCEHIERLCSRAASIESICDETEVHQSAPMSRSRERVRVLRECAADLRGVLEASSKDLPDA